MLRKLRLALVLWMLSVVMMPGVVAAHPLDQLIHDMRVQVLPDQVTLHVRLVAGPLITTRLWDQLDRDGSGTLSAAEQRVWCEDYLTTLDVAFDTTMLVFTLDDVRNIPVTKADFIGAAATELELTAHAPLPAVVAAGAHELSLGGTALRDISIYDWSKTRGRYGIVAREATTLDAQMALFPISWPAQFRDYAPSEATSATSVPPTDTSNALAAYLQRGGGAFGLAALGAALLFGALHALQPGHGKTLVAAYLVGSRGTLRDAVALGGIVTFTHTASVLVLGTLVLSFSAWIKPEQIIPGLTLVSGVLVVVIGLKLLRDRLHTARHPALHSHDHQHPHDHSHDHSHHHDLPTTITGRALISLGVSGGLVPCTEALVILIVAATLGQLALGLAMIVAFSVGLAAVLIAIGVLMVTAGERLLRRVDRNGPLLRWLPVISALLVVGLGAALAVGGVFQIF